MGDYARKGRHLYFHRMILLVTVVTDNIITESGLMGNWATMGHFPGLNVSIANAGSARCEARALLCDAKDASERYARAGVTRALVCAIFLSRGALTSLLSVQILQHI